MKTETLDTRHLSLVQFKSLSTEQKVAFYRRDGYIFDVLISQQFDRLLLEELITIANATRKIAKDYEGMVWLRSILAHKRAMLYFIQPSTRTFLSFLNACHILGVQVSEVRDPSTSSEVKGETPSDTIRTFSSYVDMIIMRHPSEGFAETAAWVLNNSDRPVPVINAGSGRDQHPTQALLDIYTLQRSFEEYGGIDGKSIAMVGDLMRGRTVRSLSYLLTNYKDVTIHYVAPDQLRMLDDIKLVLRKKKVKYYENDDIMSVLPHVDAVYMTRIQDEYEVVGAVSEKDYERFHLLKRHLSLLKDNTIIMHPLPRRKEIDPSIDGDPRAMYWRQERNGMWIRAALLLKIFRKEKRILEYDVSHSSPS